MSTFAQLTDRVEAVLHGYTENTEPTSWLTTSATTTTTTMTVHDATVVGRGYVQVNDEIIFVNNTDNVANTLTISPWGTINAMYPSVFAVGSYDFDYVAARYSYSIPAEVENVLSVTYSTIGPSREWFPARGWQIDRTADTDAFSNGKSLSIYSEIVPGQTVHVSYSKRPTLLTNNSDDYETTTGFPSYSEDVVIYGAAFRMISFLDPSRLGPQSAAADILDGVRPTGSGQNTARFLYNIYQQRLNEVADNQRRQHPIRSHYQR